MLRRNSISLAHTVNYNAKWLRRSMTGSAFLVNVAVFSLFKKLYGHMNIPHDYIIGNDPNVQWPKHLNSFRLGDYAKYVRKGMKSKSFNVIVHKQLEDLGFSCRPMWMSNTPDLRPLLAFKSIYGHLRIPDNYRIDNSHGDVWPDGSNGRHLGSYAQEIRRRLRLNMLPPETVQQLHDMNFPVSAAVNFEVLQLYKSKYGNLTVPKDFVVPSNSSWPSPYHGLALGKYVQNVRRKLREGYCSTDTQQRLRELGMTDTVKASIHETVVLACKTFLEKHPHGVVPSKFVVPEGDDSWPTAAWGLRLGRHLRDLRNDREPTYPPRVQLEQLGISFTKRTDFERHFAALQVYKRVHEGSVKVPVDFVVPPTDETYPVECRRLKLGIWLNGIRTAGNYAEHKQRLQDLGVVYPKRTPFDVVFGALTVYKTLHGHVNVPSSFVVPEGDVSFDRAAWGLKLGQALSSIKQGSHSKHRDRLEGLGVSFDRKKYLEFDSFLAALKVYKSLHDGNVNVPLTYAIPHDDERYPEETRGLLLGGKVREYAKSCSKNPQRWQQLAELGVECNTAPRDSKKLPFEVVFAALSAYKAAHGSVNITQSYVVPEGDARFDDQFWGMKLGQIMKNIRAGLIHKEHTEAFKELGVVFPTGKPDDGFEEVCDALQAYKRIEGTSKVKTRHVIPLDDERYPEEMRGIKLGNRLRSFRLRLSSDDNRLQKLDAILAQ